VNYCDNSKFINIIFCLIIWSICSLENVENKLNRWEWFEYINIPFREALGKLIGKDIPPYIFKNTVKNDRE